MITPPAAGRWVEKRPSVGVCRGWWGWGWIEVGGGRGLLLHGGSCDVMAASGSAAD